MTVQEIKKIISIRDILYRYNVLVNSRGFARCPFHDEITASMKIYEDTQSFYCFGCGTGGDIIAFVIALYGIGYQSAITRICCDFSLPTCEYPSYRQRAKMRIENQKLIQGRHDSEARVSYSKYAYVLLSRYHRWLLKQQKTQAIMFDIQYLDRLLARYLSPENIITFDVKALINALYSKHRKGGNE